MDKIKMRDIFTFLICISLCLAAGGLGSLFTAPAIPTWYEGLQKPSFNPPNWLFAPVWTVLYILMGISLFLIWRKDGKNSKSKAAKIVFSVQLVLNTLWSILFFGLKIPLLAFIEILILWIAILVTIFLFYPKSKLASFLLIPYILWVSFASFLNGIIMILN